MTVQRVFANTHPHGVRRSPYPHESLEDYQARMTADRRTRLQARYTPAGTKRTGDDA